jgi:hypothetical protein
MSRSFPNKCACVACAALVGVSLAGGFSAEDCPQQALCRSLPPDQVHGQHEDQRTSPPEWTTGIRVDRPPVAETNPHYLAQFKPAKLFVSPFLYQLPALDVPLADPDKF